MTNRCGIRAALSAALLLLIATSTAAQVVSRVIDGDTIVVEGVGTVRLIGVDTPETVDPRKQVQAFGKEASDFVRRLAAGKVVRLEYEGTKTDRFSRTLAYAYLADGVLLNREIIRQGFGYAYLEFPFSKMEEFRAAQRDAMNQRKGLWTEYVPTKLEPLPRCQAITLEGDQCKRHAAANSRYCWQHTDR